MPPKPGESSKHFSLRLWPGGPHLENPEITEYELKARQALLDPIANICIAAKYLRILKTYKNRWPTKVTLSDHEMSILATEYNIGHTESAADKARTGPYGEAFLRELPRVRLLLEGKSPPTVLDRVRTAVERAAKRLNREMEIGRSEVSP